MMLKKILLLIVILFSTSINAETEGILNQLLAPGPLMLGHKDLEAKDCLKCHAAGKGLDDQKCLSCHKEIKKLITSKTGLHGLQTTSCRKCHSDHKGREMDTTEVDTSNFDHFKMTGYSLDGKHSEIKCIDCHKEKRLKKQTRKTDTHFIGQTSSCKSCHQKDDPHHFIGKYDKNDCNSCHSNLSWKKDIKFNHDKDTNFKLIEKHAELKCTDCHQSNNSNNNQLKTTFKYQWNKLEQDKCLSCHKDFHKQNIQNHYKNSCIECHSQKTWSIESFQHSVTGFKLNGKHSETKCLDCHKQNKNINATATNTKHPNYNYSGLKKQCLSCHNDVHKFANFKSKKLGDLNQCLKCHNETSFKDVHDFNHSKDTQFKIDGKHQELKCSECHLPSKAENTKLKNNLITLKTPQYHWDKLEQKTCETCHTSPHKNTFSDKLLKQKCTSCHTTQDWSLLKSESGFDHSKTRFELTGAHLKTKCSDCHGKGENQKFKFKSVDSKFCIDCHKSIHTKQFDPQFASKNCMECHNTNSFKEILNFRHETTRYPLIGKHSEVQCKDCHQSTPETISIAWPNFKSSVHTDLKIINSSQYVFHNFQAENCLSCHKDYHQSQLSKNCRECHSENGWKPIQFNHNLQSKFSLKGQHAKLDCVQCHSSDKQSFQFKNEKRFNVHYKPIPSSNCSDCHSDFHKGQLSQKCQECHAEDSWKKTKFIHNLQSEFKLKDKHENLECSKCHSISNEIVSFHKQNFKVQKFKPINNSCSTCHKDPHKGSYGKSCQECHSEKSWKQTKDFHKNFSLKGIHYSIDCNECHQNNKKLAGQSQQCLSCHQKDDIHNGMLPNCSSCHTQYYWEASHFKHSLTKFPLRGAHRSIECSDCHTNGIYKGLSTNCYTCHQSDFAANPSPHASGNTNCTSCHRNTFTFKSVN